MGSTILLWVIKNPQKTVVGTLIIILMILLAIQSAKLSYTRSELNRERGTSALLNGLVDKQNQKVKQLYDDSKKAKETLIKYKEESNKIKRESDVRIQGLLNSGKVLTTCEESIKWLSQQRP